MKKFYGRQPNKVHKTGVALCKCGCGSEIEIFDGRNRPREYAQGHSCAGRNKGTKKERIKSIINWHFVGRPVSEVTKHKISVTLKEGYKNGDYKIWASGLYGEDHPLYKKDKTTPIRKLVEQLPQYLLWRDTIFGRDKSCTVCQSKEGLEIDHLVSFSNIVKMFNIKTTKDAVNCSLLWDANNGRVLCNPCHRNITFGKGVV